VVAADVPSTIVTVSPPAVAIFERFVEIPGRRL
jgi:hypothetical protein